MPTSRHIPAGEGFKYVGGSYGYFLSKYDWREHKFEQAVRWGYMFIEEGIKFDVCLPRVAVHAVLLSRFYYRHCHGFSGQ
jgi:hypothetical protein